tara:strand:+ start:57 stop:446 length:390 start_codon:yes stop_codon:yes gene_type:complete
MHLKKFQKSLSDLRFEVKNEIVPYYKLKEDLEIGYIYTYFNVLKNKMLIGFIQSSEIPTILYKENGYMFIEKRSGTKRESDLLKKTLLELGHEDNNSTGIYNFSKELINHLNILGWPIGKFKKYQKRYK